MEAWFGYLTLSRPTTREACNNLTSEWLVTLEQIKADRPGFGYGPLTQDLMNSMQTEGYVTGTYFPVSCLQGFLVDCIRGRSARVFSGQSRIRLSTEC